MDNLRKHLYDFALLPADTALVSEIASAAAALTNKLSSLKLESLQISDYNKRYFGKYVRGSSAATEHITHLLLWALAFHRCRLEELVVVDYGGGSGYISLLLKQLGVGTVIYNDIYDVSCQDAKVIGEAMELAADHYVCGDVGGLLDYLQKFSLKPNVVISSDTIEHIYDIDAFIDQICGCSQGPLSLVLASSANTLNPRTRWLIRAHHRRCESQDGKAEWGHKERDTLQSFLKARKGIIQKHCSHLRAEEVELLATRTRGLMECDIKRQVDEYVRTGVLPREPADCTNTCDPFTGNWAEHLMNPYELLARMERHGFSGQVLAGYYHRYQNRWKQILTRILNLTMSHSGSLGLRLAPYYVVYARNF